MSIAIEIHGGTIVVDAEDAERVRQYKWYVTSAGYARSDYGKRAWIHLHTLLLGKSPVGMVPDHKNRNGLDNTRDNLRFISFRGNALNTSYRPIGYYFRKERNVWVVRFKINGIQKYFGHYQTREEAREVANTVYDKMLAEELK